MLGIVVAIWGIWAGFTAFHLGASPQNLDAQEGGLNINVTQMFREASLISPAHSAHAPILRKESANKAKVSTHNRRPVATILSARNI